MMKQLPADYLKRMSELPGLNFGEFLKSYEKEPVRALRFTGKARPDTIQKLVDEWSLQPVNWCERGWRYDGSLRPGLSPYHDAGVYYIQDPGAMYVAEAAGITDDDVILDLCAAPGGKTTRAAELGNFVLSNEIIPGRAKILSSNIERLGLSNTIVCQTTPERIASVFPAYFDAVFVDAPCSGEGMMRKDDTAIAEWSPANVELCEARQTEILDHADKTLSEGGKLIYSTCTFEPCENELQIRKFLSSHPGYELIKEHTVYPHLEEGEGQYFAVLIKGGRHSAGSGRKEPEKIRKNLQQGLASSGIHILRSGLMKGEYIHDKKKGRIYVPSHAEIMASSFNKPASENAVNLMDEQTAVRFLSGNVLREEDQDLIIRNNIDGYLGVYFDGYPLGLGKKTGNVIKNHLPKGLRRLS